LAVTRGEAYGVRPVGHWTSIEALLKKYADRPISLADACLIRCAEIHQEARILTFDDDFSVYKWARNRKFEILSRIQPLRGDSVGRETGILATPR
jgi:hypothetical protein